MYLQNGKKLLDLGFTHADISYPPGWLSLATPEDLAQVEVVVVPDIPRPDGRFCAVEEQPDGTYVCTPYPREQIAARQWEDIKAERERRKAGGFKIGDKWFHSDDASRIQQLTLVMTGTNIPAGLQWKTMDGSFVTMTPQLANQILAAGAASDQTIFSAAEIHRAAMEASADPASYDFSAGWPKVYGE